MLLAVGNDVQFRRFCEAADRPELARDPRFTNNSQRVNNRELLVEQLTAITRKRSTGEWIMLLEQCAVPCGPINDIAQAFDDPHVKARGLAMEMHRQAGDGIDVITSIASPLRLSENAPAMRRAPPALGQHTDEVLRELGVDPVRQAALRAASVI
jgi:formyl-CoA transferase